MGIPTAFETLLVVVFSVRKTRGLKIVVADDFGIYASAPSWMMLDVECYARWWFHIFFKS